MAEKKKKRYFLVDYENVHKGGLFGVEELHKSDTVFVFYSEHADSLSFEVMALLKATKAKVEYIKVDTLGLNALDFQLSSYVGYLFGKKPGCRCYIISNDKGYSNIQVFWEKYGETVRLQPCIGKRKCSVKKADVEKAVFELQDLEVSEKERSVQIVWKQLKAGSRSLSDTKVAINNDLMQYFGSEKTKIIYGAIKPLIK